MLLIMEREKKLVLLSLLNLGKSGKLEIRG